MWTLHFQRGSEIYSFRSVINTLDNPKGESIARRIEAVKRSSPVLFLHAIILKMEFAKRFDIILIVLILSMLSCSGKKAVRPSGTFDPEKAFTEANEQLEKKDYEQARAAFLEIKNRDMSKKFAPLAQLKIADSYVKEDETQLAVSAYQN